MTELHHQQLYKILRGDCDPESLELDVFAAEELEQMLPVLREIEAQAEARGRANLEAEIQKGESPCYETTSSASRSS